jgi:hypothetical protein
MTRSLIRSASLLAVLTLAACDAAAPTRVAAPDTPDARLGKSAGGGGRPGGSGPTTTPLPTFLSPEAGAPAASTAQVAFWAVQGKDRKGEVWYHATPGEPDSTRMLRLRVRKKAQIIRPDGTLLAPGDSIRITMQVIDPITMATQFEPSGLRFVGSEAADLTMWYLHADLDLNDDGVVNAADRTIELTFSIFKQESATAPWTRVTSVVMPTGHEVEANIDGFTNYVIAY